MLELRNFRELRPMAPIRDSSWTHWGLQSSPRPVTDPPPPNFLETLTLSLIYIVLKQTAITGVYSFPLNWNLVDRFKRGSRATGLTWVSVPIDNYLFRFRFSSPLGTEHGPFVWTKKLNPWHAKTNCTKLNWWKQAPWLRAKNISKKYPRIFSTCMSSCRTKDFKNCSFGIFYALII